MSVATAILLIAAIFIAVLAVFGGLIWWLTEPLHRPSDSELQEYMDSFAELRT